MTAPLPSLCRDCLHLFQGSARCPNCGSPRFISHAELKNLSIAHMDCDAFYASVEKRDNPSLKDKPVIVGGEHRGVVSTACYIARISGVHSAMPMFEAKKRCPEAVIVPPRMSVYVEVSRQIHEMMAELTPAIEPISLDEAFIDLTGTEKLHGKPPAYMLAQLILKMECELGISGSIGLSHNKFLAKLASDLEKPRGFSVIGKTETMDLLAPLPIKKIWGVGKVMQKKMHHHSIRTFSDLRSRPKASLVQSYGVLGNRLWHLARGEDVREIASKRTTKSISNEITFSQDISSLEKLKKIAWRLSDKVSMRAKQKSYVGKVVYLKLKQSNHQIVTRRRTVFNPTQMTFEIFEVVEHLLTDCISKAPFRLLGVGLSDLEPYNAGTHKDLLSSPDDAISKAERVRDELNKKFGPNALIQGKSIDKS